jgi:hypothetical protein
MSQNDQQKGSAKVYVLTSESKSKAIRVIFTVRVPKSARCTCMMYRGDHVDESFPTWQELEGRGVDIEVLSELLQKGLQPEVYHKALEYGYDSEMFEELVAQVGDGEGSVERINEALSAFIERMDSGMPMMMSMHRRG